MEVTGVIVEGLSPENRNCIDFANQPQTLLNIFFKILKKCVHMSTTSSSGTKKGPLKGQIMNTGKTSNG